MSQDDYRGLQRTISTVLRGLDVLSMQGVSLEEIVNRHYQQLENKRLSAQASLDDANARLERFRHTIEWVNGKAVHNARIRENR